MLGQLRRRRRAYAPTSNTASQDNHEKINSWVSFIFPLHDEYGAPLGGPWGRRSSAIISLEFSNCFYNRIEGKFAKETAGAASVGSIRFYQLD